MTHMTEAQFKAIFGLPEEDDRRSDFSLPDTYDVGDVVRLIVGGPDMVVLGYCEECGDVDVAWGTSDFDVMRDTFPEEALVHADFLPDCDCMGE